MSYAASEQASARASVMFVVQVLTARLALIHYHQSTGQPLMTSNGISLVLLLYYSTRPLHGFDRCAEHTQHSAARVWSAWPHCDVIDWAKKAENKCLVGVTNSTIHKQMVTQLEQL